MNEKEKLLSEGNIVQTILKLSLPLIVSQLINVLYNIVDRIYIGNIAEIGKEALAGVGITFPIIAIISAFAQLFGMGGAPLAAIKLGEKNVRDARNIMTNSFFMLLITGIILTIIVITYSVDLLYLFGAKQEIILYAKDYLVIYALGSVVVLLNLGLTPYLTFQGFTNITMISNLIGALLNIILDALFIFQFGLGVKGAAIATIISQTVSCIFIISFLSGKKSILKLSLSRFKPDFRVILSIIALGVSPFIMSATESLVQITFNLQIKKYGGENYVIYLNIITIALSLMQFITLPINGFASGSSPLISYNYGSGAFERVNATVKILLKVSVTHSLLCYLIILCIPQYLTQIFNSNPELLSLSPKLLRIFFIGMSIFGLQIACQSAFVALRQTLISITLASLRKIILLVPLTLILPIYIGIDGVFISESVADTIAVITTICVFLIYFPKIINKRKKVLTLGKNLTSVKK